MDFRISRTKKVRRSHESRLKWPKSASADNSISVKDVNDLETLPVIDKTKTPQRNTDTKINSPQFRVGWNDGFDSSVLPGAESPTIPTVQQRIRRCPDELYKDVKKTVPPKNLEIERDRELGCATWAKNLLEISLEPQKESLPQQTETPTKRSGINSSEGLCSVQRPEELACDNSRIDITDDADDELMVLCSQAIEEEVIGKRSQSSEYCQTKKQKLTDSSNSESRLNAQAITPIENRVSKVLHFDKKDVTPPRNNAEIVKKSDKIVDSMDLFKCVLDDDDEFSSFDFNYLDKIQNTYSQNRPVPEPKVNKCNPKPKYTKEQIEQRRLEAKKKLLFRKKHKSM